MAPVDSAPIVPTTIGQGGDIWRVRSVKLHSSTGDNGAQAVTALCVDTCSIETRPLPALSMGCIFVSWHFPLVFLHVFKVAYSHGTLEDAASSVCRLYPASIFPVRSCGGKSMLSRLLCDSLRAPQTSIQPSLTISVSIWEEKETS